MPKKIAPESIHVWTSDSEEPFVASMLTENLSWKKAILQNGWRKPVKNILSVSEVFPPIFAGYVILISIAGALPFIRIATKNIHRVSFTMGIGSALRKKLLTLAPFIWRKKQILPLPNITITIMTENYDSSWDLIESNKGYLPIDDDAFERKYQEWKTRNWPLWLKEHLTFPFTEERMEDDDDRLFSQI